MVDRTVSVVIWYFTNYLILWYFTNYLILWYLPVDLLLTACRTVSTAQSEMQIGDAMGHLPINHSVSHNFSHRGESPAFSEVPMFGRGGSRYRGPSYAAHFRRSMPNVNMHQHSNEPAKMIPYHLLVTSNYRLPPNIDRCHLEVSTCFTANFFANWWFRWLTVSLINSFSD